MITISSSINGKCSICGKPAIIFREHSGQYLCKDCFIKSIEKIVNKTVSKYNMLEPDDLIVVGFSGGKDSTALLHNLIQIQQKTHDSRDVIALSIDEGIKDYRDEAIRIAKEFCKKSYIEHHVINFKEEFGSSLDEIINHMRESEDHLYACNYCATIRRRLLNDYAKKLGASKLALGHNLTDFAETFLMNILYKRTKLIGNQYPLKKEPGFLQNIFVRKIFPLMRIPEVEIQAYLEAKEIDYYPKHCPYREMDPILRKRVLQFINDTRILSPEIEFNLLNTFLELSEMLNREKRVNSLKFCESCGHPSGNKKLCRYCALKSLIGNKKVI